MIGWLWSAALVVAQADPPEIQIEGTRNGSFAMEAFEEVPGLPFWKVAAGQPSLEDGVLVLPPGAEVSQPFAAPSAESLSFSFRFEGPLEAWIEDAEKVKFPIEVRSPEFSSLGPGGGIPQPRFQLFLACPKDASEAARIQQAVAVPRLGLNRQAMELRLEAELVACFKPWIENALDTSGPRESSFVTRVLDADTGQPIGPLNRMVSIHPVYTQLLSAWRLAPRPEWEPALVRYAEDFLAYGLHPETGLPRAIDPVRDEPLDQVALEIQLHLKFLIDLYENGPSGQGSPSIGERALDAAVRAGDTILRTGRQPDGSLAAKYVPATGQPDTGVIELRRLDVASQLARLAAHTGREDFAAAAREAVLAFDQTRYWPGTWDRIDPGFDDEYGHYGARAVTMWQALPDEPTFRGVALSGLETYLPLWRGALAHGGNIAADQVRCWEIAAACAVLEPQLTGAVLEVLDLAVHVHWTGQQNRQGVWVDTTVYGFDPQNLPVGDTLGVPQNLLVGLGVFAALQEPEDRLRTAAQFFAVLDRTRKVFGAEFGYVDGPPGSTAPGEGRVATGSIRVAPGLISMWEALEQQK